MSIKKVSQKKGQASNVRSGNDKTESPNATTEPVGIRIDEAELFPPPDDGDVLFSELAILLELVDAGRSATFNTG